VTERHASGQSPDWGGDPRRPWTAPISSTPPTSRTLVAFAILALLVGGTAYVYAALSMF
jgi:hypothetical protein